MRLLDGARNPKWSTNVSGPGTGNYAAEAQLKDTGNFILKQGNSTVWESFDDGGDTLMPEMRLKLHLSGRLGPIAVLLEPRRVYSSSVKAREQ
nr:G-type lectin S-receptor-like serine/threonine-protein kinase At4g27290 [Ipomoea batatas]